MSDTRTLSTEMEAIFSAVLDTIVPPSADGRFPGAGQLGLAEPLAASAELLPLLAGGLTSVDEAARARGADGFVALAVGERREVLEAASARAPGFLPLLVAHTFLAYYQAPRVFEALGLDARPPFPRGYPVAPTDFAILDPVRRLEPIYRKP